MPREHHANYVILNDSLGRRRVDPPNHSSRHKRLTITISSPNEICLPIAGSSFSTVEVFENCSGGNSRLSYLLGCGGRSFFDQEAVRFGGCSGEEQPPSIRVRVASYFFDQKIGVQQRPHCRDRTVMRFFALNKPIHVVAFSLDAAALNAVILLVRLSIDVNSYATSGIFFRFQVTDFDFRFAFFSLCHFDFLTMLD